MVEEEEESAVLMATLATAQVELSLSWGWAKEPLEIWMLL